MDVCPQDAFSAGCLHCPPHWPVADHLARLLHAPGQATEALEPPPAKFHPVPVRPVFAPVASEPPMEPPVLEPVPAPLPQTPLTLR